MHRENKAEYTDNNTHRHHSTHDKLKQIGTDGRNATHETAQWYEAATTQSEENAKLAELLEESGTKCRRLTDSVTRLSQLRQALENELAATKRDVIHLSASGHAITPSIAAPTRIQPIPVNTEGRDAMHWYQTCRTMEAQNIQRNAELEARMEKLSDRTTTPQNKRKKRESTAQAQLKL